MKMKLDRLDLWSYDENIKIFKEAVDVRSKNLNTTEVFREPNNLSPEDTYTNWCWILKNRTAYYENKP